MTDTSAIPSTLPGGRTLGAHLPMADGMVRAVDRIAEVGGGALQIFTDNPTSWRRRAEPPAEQAAFRARLADRSIGPVAIHAPYLVNLAGPEEELYARSVELLASEVAVAPGFAGRFVNVHIGSHRGAGRERGSRGSRRGSTWPSRGCRPTPRRPGSSWRTRPAVDSRSASPWRTSRRSRRRWRRVASAATASRSAWTPRTCGEPDTRSTTPTGVDDLLARVESLLGPGSVAMVHLNDSKAERGSRFDRHEHLGAGRIGAVGLHRLLTHPSLAGVPHYLETPGMDEGYDALNVRNALRIAAGQPMEPVPPEALKARGSAGLTAPD